MTFNEFINSPDDMDEDSQEYKDFSQCVSSGAYVAFSVMEDILDATPTFNLSSADSLSTLFRSITCDKDGNFKVLFQIVIPSSG